MDEDQLNSRHSWTNPSGSSRPSRPSRSSVTPDPSTEEHFAVAAKKVLRSPLFFLMTVLLAGGGGWAGVTITTSHDLDEIKGSIRSVEESQAKNRDTLVEIRESSLIASSERTQIHDRVLSLEEKLSKVTDQVRDLELERARRDGLEWKKRK